ncbi:hypothetical protein DNTS_023936 [Danionella cerebrum]|uniref:HIT domain-containing protein n=1 Tax=Danionella cerebrum TaxID=2873325 RepID=A0A553MV27_9TELE|nr:hypothetical protein DNTS_023936 [Danionella translucida]
MADNCCCEIIRESSEDCSDDSCVFCVIAKGEDPETEILAQDEEIICFKDIYPVAPFHFLVIPRKHIHSCLSLSTDHISLVQRMAKMGREVLKANNCVDFQDISLGFHVPPYITVPHLHLHVLAPFSQLFKWAIFKYKNVWYITEEKMIQQLKDKKRTCNKCGAV